MVGRGEWDELAGLGGARGDFETNRIFRSENPGLAVCRPGYVRFEVPVTLEWDGVGELAVCIDLGEVVVFAKGGRSVRENVTGDRIPVVARVVR